jgi:hypothetical protein
MAISPYIEAPTVRTTQQPVSGGIDIRSYERLTQGISRKNKRRQLSSILPLMGSGREDFTIEQINFGEEAEFESGTPYSDRGKVTAQAYLENPSQFEDLSVGDFLPIEGSIEPLVIRDEAGFRSIEDPIAHKVRGAVMAGNIDFENKTDLVLSYFEIENLTNFDYYLDSFEMFGDILLPGFIGEGERKIVPFSDSKVDDRFLTSDGEINGVLLAMTGSVDDHFLLDRTKAATSGFVYSNKEGTDSIAFGGFLKG